MKRRVSILAVLLALPTIAFGSLFESDFDTAAGWTVLAETDTAYTFGWDFTSMGVPASPGGSTTGLKLEANITGGVARQIAVVSTDFVATGKYVVEFDFWINANGPFPAGGNGSTEFLGGGVGHNGTTIGRNGASLIIDGEGNSANDWRLYKNTGLQYPASGQYDITTNNNTDVELVAQFPQQSAPAYQQANYPQQTGMINAGSGGFAWHHMTITADGTAGTANFTVDGLSIGTINANIGSTVAVEGHISIVYADLFASLSNNAALSWGVVDNLVVTPEPSALALLALGGLALLRRR